MDLLKSAFKNKKRKGYDSDSVGYFSTSSDHSFTRSQFILRPSSTYSCLTSSSCMQLDYEEFPSSSYSASIYSHEPSIDYMSNFEQSSADDDDNSTLRDEYEQEDEEDEDEYYNYFNKLRRNNSEESIYATSTIYSPGSISDDYEFEELFQDLDIDADNYVSTNENSTLKRKKILIKEPDASSKIYFNERLAVGHSIPNNGTIPRSILKKEPSLSHSHIYEEIENDHLCPLPNDVRPNPPIRPIVLPIKIFPPCQTFQPRRLDARFASARKPTTPKVKRTSTFTFGFLTLGRKKKKPITR